MGKQIVNGGPAFPTMGMAPGMNLRDWFAGQVLVGLCGTDSSIEWAASHFAAAAYAIADAMMGARSLDEVD